MAIKANSITPWLQEAMGKYQWLDELLLEQKGTEKIFQPAWQAYKYMLRDKMYAYIGMNDKKKRPILTLKLEPELSEMLRIDYCDIVPGYYMNKLYWSTVYLDGDVPQKLYEKIITASHKALLSSFSQKVQKEIMGE